TASALRTSQRELAAVVMDALAAGWPDQKLPDLSEADIKGLRELMEALPGDAKSRLLVLSQKWGHPEIFQEQQKAIVDALLAKLSDASATQDARLTAATKLVETDASDSAVNAILKQITPQTAPTLQTGLIESLS